MPQKKQKVNWLYNGNIIDDLSKTPKDSISFIYKITNLTNGKYYIGRKTMVKPKFTSGKNKGQSKGEYSWKTYNGSSKELLADIKKGDNYSKEIIKFCFSKAETTYEEGLAILCSGGLIDPNCYNYWIKMTVYSKNLNMS